jgi:hypothetical protein
MAHALQLHPFYYAPTIVNTVKKHYRDLLCDAFLSLGRAGHVAQAALSLLSSEPRLRSLNAVVNRECPPAATRMDENPLDSIVLLS